VTRSGLTRCGASYREPGEDRTNRELVPDWGIPVNVAVFGLGEAGSLLAADLAMAGATVRGYDPADVPTPAGVERFDDPGDAVHGADLVMACVVAADACAAATQALDAIPDGVVYADLGTGSAELKRELADIVGPRLAFADVALMTVVPGNGLATPSLASGGGADRYVELVAPLGAVVETVGLEPGIAATRKLLRSVVTKGLAALIIEALRGAEAAGETEWVWGNIVHQLTVTDEVFVRRLVEGTALHDERRLHEMEASRDLLAALGVEPLMTSATAEHLASVSERGLPDLPPSSA
jgi:3-hydroxyisobutyrate dehydrogenase-like beta-hydroxyacid dehydrogenase